MGKRPGIGVGWGWPWDRLLEERLTTAVARMAALAPGLPAELADRLPRVMRELTGAMAADENMVRLPSVLAGGVACLVGAPPDLRHAFMYRPCRAPTAAVVFLHGHGGNMKLAPWLWTSTAELLGLCILAPSFGFGNWEAASRGSVRVVMRAREWVVSQLGIADDAVWLAGLSQGGAGVSRAAAADPNAWRGLIYISPTLEPHVIGRRDFRSGWAGRPVLLIHGGRDLNVPAETVLPVFERMRRAGIRVSFHFWPEEDHFLYFARRAELFELIAATVRQRTDEQSIGK